jgi:hypothetical protein
VTSRTQRRQDMPLTVSSISIMGRARSLARGVGCVV